MTTIRTQVRCRLLGERAAYGAVARERISCRKSGARRSPGKLPLRGGGRMTAEIALLNRRAIAFAADSAVTISDGTNEKIYNSAEKIFESSRKVPLGIMLYNTIEFAGIPLDVLVRKFRSERDEEFQSANVACDKFINFLKSLPNSIEQEAAYLEFILADELNDIAKEHSKKFQKRLIDRINAIVAAGAEYAIKPSDFDFKDIHRATFIDIINDHASTYAESVVSGYLGDISDEDFIFGYKGALIKSINRNHALALINNEQSIIDSISKLAACMARSDLFSNHCTGIVFGGFGASNMFPELYSVEIDGMYFGKIKRKIYRDVKIDKNDHRAEIIPFAQSEMVERFLFGINSELESSLLKFIRHSSEKTLKLVEEKSGFDLKSIPMDSEIYSSDIEKLIERLKRKSRNETYDMVDFMPKQELAYAAEAFVSLTTIKRKVSSQRETVGGPIDVAIITRNEGFVWIKRKHYFTAEFNPGYNARTFLQAKEGKPNDSA